MDRTVEIYIDFERIRRADEEGHSISSWIFCSMVNVSYVQDL